MFIPFVGLCALIMDNIFQKGPSVVVVVVAAVCCPHIHNPVSYNFLIVCSYYCYCCYLVILPFVFPKCYCYDIDSVLLVVFL